MASRSYKQFTILNGGTAQPLVGTRLTANSGLNSVNPDGSGFQTLTVADSSMLMAGEEIFICTPTFTNGERVRCMKIVDATHILVKGLKFIHVGGAAGTGEWVAFAGEVNSVYVQGAVGGAGLLYIGNQGLNKTGLVHVVKTIFNVTTGQPSDFSDQLSEGPNASSAADWWIDGTTGDTYLPTFGVV